MPLRPRRRRVIVLLLAVVTVGFLIRCRTIGDVFLEGSIVPFDPDSAYHLWRIEEMVRTGAPPHFDRFANAPVGAEVTYRDGSAVLVAAPARLLLGKDASRFDIEVWSLFFMPVAGALSLLTIFAMAQRGFGTSAGIAAAAIAAVLPEHFLAGLLGRVDHHVWEPMLGPLAVALLLGAAHATRRGLWLRAAGAGATLALFAWTVMAALLHAGVVTAALVAAALAAAFYGQTATATALLRATSGALAVAAALMLPEALYHPRLAYDERSALPLVLFAAGSVTTALFASASKWGPRALAAAVGVCALGAAALAATTLRSAAQYTSGAGVLAYINETMPLWRDPVAAVKMHSLLLPLLPVILVVLAHRRRTPGAWAVAAFGVIGFVLSCLQARFGFVLVPAMATALGATVTILWQQGETQKGAGRRCLVAAGALLCMAPCLWYLARVRLITDDALATIEAAQWLRQHTPSTGPRRGSAPAPYTVISTADDENFYAYLAERPVLATGLLDHADYKAGFVDTVHMLFGEAYDEPLFERRKVRYVVLPALDGYGEQMRRDLFDLLVHPLQRLRPTVYARLFDGEGSGQLLPGGTYLPALGHLRLVHDSVLPMRRGGSEVPAVKIFERVPGARVQGPCQAQTVRARITARSDRGRRFTFSMAAPCQGGRYELRVPYAGQVEVLDAAGQVAVTIPVQEQEVLEGRATTAAH